MTFSKPPTWSATGRAGSRSYAIWLSIHSFLTRPPNVIILAEGAQPGSLLGLASLGSGVWSVSAYSWDYILKAEECVAGPSPGLPSTKPHTLLVVKVASWKVSPPRSFCPVRGRDTGDSQGSRRQPSLVQFSTRGSKCLKD